MSDDDAAPDHPPLTSDGRYIVIAGRRWRATDPMIPPTEAAQLRAALMSARRDVGTAKRHDDKTAEAAARDRVQTAKVALGERGTPWWEQSDEERRARWKTGLETFGPAGDQMTADVDK